MGSIGKTPNGKIILGILTERIEKVSLPLEKLRARWGEEEMSSEVIPFVFTAYYQPEMGEKLFRLWVSFRNLFPVERIKELKITTMAIEQDFLNEKGGRIFNLDPGIVTLSNLCLLTHKNYAHRLYLGDGIFAELTLLYQKGRFEPLPWTYPDYRTETAQNFFQKVRERLKEDLPFSQKSL